MMKGVSVKKRLLVRFHDGCENNMSSNKLTIVKVEKIPEEKEPEFFLIIEIPEDQVELEKGYHRCVYLILQVNNRPLFILKRRRWTWIMIPMRRIWTMPI